MYGAYACFFVTMGLFNAPKYQISTNQNKHKLIKLGILKYRAIRRTQSIVGLFLHYFHYVKSEPKYMCNCNMYRTVKVLAVKG